MSRIDRRAIVAWIAGLVACAAIIAHTSFTADMSAFLPRAPTAEQRVLVDQLREGTLSRLLLVAIEGSDGATRAKLSIALAAALRESQAFAGVHNGDPSESAGDREYLFANRYLLSDAVTPERFTVQGLHAAIADSIDLLASPAGMMVKAILPRDPTGETLRLIERMSGGARPHDVDGAWASADGERALLIAQTKAAGSDIDGQQRAIALVGQRFERSRDALGPAAAGARLIVTGNGAFAVSSRATIQREVLRLSILSATLVIALLLVIYRSVIALALGLLPVLSGAIAAVAAVSAGFGYVHGLTLGFGTTLIGEAVDYSIYLFIQSERAGDRGDGSWVARFWPTIRVGVLTSICGFASLLFSGFPGLAQLGLYSITGLIVAAAVTRFVLPALLPAGFRVRDVSRLGERLERWTASAAGVRWTIAALAIVSATVLFSHRSTLWNRELSALSPVPRADLARHERLRADLGAPDSRFLAIASGATADAALAAAERAGRALDPLVASGALGGYESPALFLPSAATQAQRRNALPERTELERRLDAATAGLPLRAARLEPFVADVEAARQRTPLTRADLEGTSLAEAVDALLMRQGSGFSAMIALRPADGPGARPIDPAQVRAALATASPDDVLFIDVATETQALYAAYLRQAIGLSLAGLAAIAGLLLIALRSVARVARVLAPLIASVLVVVAAIVGSGVQLTIMHLIGMLLIVAIGSNYALFFDQRASADEHASNGGPREDGRDGGPHEHAGDGGPHEDGRDRASNDAARGSGASRSRMLASLLCANLTTVAGFGLLAFSSVPVLQAIGITVGPGAVLALAFSAMLSRIPASGADRTERAADRHRVDAATRRRTMPPVVALSIAVHALALVIVVAAPSLWPWAVGAVALDQALLFVLSIRPRGTLLGHNVSRLPIEAAARRQVALTIDDGPDPGVTPAVLDILDRFAAKATFFCVGSRVAAHSELARDIVGRGHAVENHSERHGWHFALSGVAGFVAEIETAQRTIAAVTGVAPQFFRAPAGMRNPFLDSALRRVGITLASWTRRGFDTVERDPGVVLRRLTSKLAAGDILLLHDGHAARTARGDPVILEVLPKLLEALRTAGLEPVTLRSAIPAAERPDGALRNASR